MNLVGGPVIIPRGAPVLGKYLTNDCADSYFGGFALWNGSYCWGFRVYVPRGRQFWPFNGFFEMRFKTLDLLWRLYCRGEALVHNGRRWIWPRYSCRAAEMRGGRYGFAKYKPSAGGTKMVLCEGGANSLEAIFSNDFERAIERYKFYTDMRRFYLRRRESYDSWKGPWVANKVACNIGQYEEYGAPIEFRMQVEMDRMGMNWEMPNEDQAG